MRLALTILLVSSGAAMGGTYGGVSRNFIGYSASIDCSVGSMSDHAAEGRMFHECKQRAEIALSKRAAEAAAIYRHFVAGKHRWRRLVPLLDQTAKQADWDHSVKVELPQPDELLSKPILLGLFVKQPPADREKLAVDFAASLLEAGGPLAAMKPRAEKDAADTQQLLLGMAGLLRTNPLGFMRLCVERKEEIAELAARTDPLPKKYAWQGDQSGALPIARILDAFLRGQPLPPSSDPDVARMIALLTP